MRSGDLGARARLEAAFAREERRGLMLAAATRAAAVVIIIGWLALSNPERGLAYAWVLGTAGFFLVTGLAQFWVYFRGMAPPITPFAFMLVDSLALAAVLLLPYLDPNYVSVLKYQNEIIAFLLVSAGLALLVRRSRTLVAERAEAERARGNLARYFSPKVVDTLAERDEPLGRVRRQAVASWELASWSAARSSRPSSARPPISRP